VAPKLTQPPTIDGKLDDAAWRGVPWTQRFVGTMTGARSSLGTRAKLAWDDQHLYIAFENPDRDILATMTERDARLWQEEAVEVMIDADGNRRSYIELQVAPNGNVLDIYLPQYRQYEDSLDPARKPFDWNSRMRAAVHVRGTLNDPKDRDEGWTVEIALPFADVQGLAAEPLYLPPRVGDVFRVNLFRIDRSSDGRGDACGWSAPLVGDFHALDRFGYLLFGDERGETPAFEPR
jgi:hypothetical protein